MKSITRKTLLYKSEVEYADYCLNHVEGCAHGCRFPCYAMLMKIRCGIVKNYNDWIHPKIVGNALELLEKEIPKYKSKIKFVHLCFSTDPLMYKHSDVVELTLKIIERLNKDNIHCVVLTKGVFPSILANAKKYSKNNEYGISIVSLDNMFKKRYEPYSAPYKDRIKSLKYLHNHGLKTWVSMEPYPTPNLVKQNLQVILNEVSFTDKIIFGKLNYNVDASNSVYKESKVFYEECANKIISFCRRNNIEYHIKYGTQKNVNTTTGNIFMKNSYKSLDSKNSRQLSLSVR